MPPAWFESPPERAFCCMAFSSASISSSRSRRENSSSTVGRRPKFHQIGLGFHTLHPIFELGELGQHLAGIGPPHAFLGAALVLGLQVTLHQGPLLFRAPRPACPQAAEYLRGSAPPPSGIRPLGLQMNRPGAVALLLGQGLAANSSLPLSTALWALASHSSAFSLIKMNSRSTFLASAMAPAQRAFTSTRVSSISWIISRISFSGSSAGQASR